MTGLIGIPNKKNPYFSNVAGAAAFSVGEEATDVITVRVTLKTPQLGAVAGKAGVFFFLSDDASGNSVVGTAADGGVASGTNGFLMSLVTGKAGFAVTEDDGTVDIAVTHSGGAKTCYLCVVLPTGGVAVSGAVTFA